jgi:hypothetical protein
VLPFWGPDSAAIYFLDRPPNGVLGTYRVDLTGDPATMFEAGAAEFSPDLVWAVTKDGGAVVLHNRIFGQTWRVASEGRMVRFSPQSDWIAWQIQSSNVADLDRRRWSLSLGSLDTRDVTAPLSGIGGGFIGWGISESNLLFSGRQEMAGPAGLWRSSVAGDDLNLIFPADAIRSPLVSPDGGWVALTVAFSGDQENDGLWIVATQTGGAFKVPQFGAYRWRSEGQLLVIPLENGQMPLRLVEASAPDGSVRELSLGPNEIPPIANNTWEVSPDGRWLLIQAASDGNLWLLRLPDEMQAP